MAAANGSRARPMPLPARYGLQAAAFLAVALAVLVVFVPRQVEQACLRAAGAGGAPAVTGRVASGGESARAAAVALAARHEANRVRGLVLALGLGILAAGIAVAAWTGTRLARPIRESIGALEAVAIGDLTPRLANGRPLDEPGRLAATFNRTLDDLRETMRGFALHAQSVAEASAGLTAASGEMKSHAEETSTLSALVTDSTEEATRSIQTVAAGIEEMGTSITEIAKNAAEAARIAASAVQVTDGANAIFVKLGESSVEIGNVLKVITSIAEQTNLLALNATIEAARAGEAGRGFAVVANEVKELARQAARAAEDIAHKIQAIQSDTSRATEAIGQIDRTINQISDIQVVIANSVEEQTATTSEIGRNIAEVARTSSGIGQAVARVSRAARETLEGSGGRVAAEASLERTAAELQAAVGRFRF